MTLKRLGHLVFPWDALFLVSSSRNILRTPRKRTQEPNVMDA